MKWLVAAAVAIVVLFAVLPIVSRAPGHSCERWAIDHVNGATVQTCTLWRTW